jgi:hypothetical protein
VDAILDKEELMSRGTTSIATQGGVGAMWREKVKDEPQTPTDGNVVPAGPPHGTVPAFDLLSGLNRKA